MWAYGNNASGLIKSQAIPTVTVSLWGFSPYFIPSLVEAADLESHMNTLLVHIISLVPYMTVIEHTGRLCLYLNIFIEEKVMPS